MKCVMKYLFLGVILILSYCGPSPTVLWLEEYEMLLSQGVRVFSIDPYSEEMEKVQLLIAEKEAEVNGLLRNSSMQEQMNFLSRYYEMRVNFYYAVQ